MLFLFVLIVLGLVQNQGWRSLLAMRTSTSSITTVAQPAAVNAGPPAVLLLQANALALPMGNGTTQVTARVRDAQGKPVAGSLVQFQSVLGSVNPASVTTDANGAAVVNFQAGGTAGRAVVTATVNGLNREAAIQLTNPATSATTNVVTVDFGASKLEPGQQTNFSAVLRDSTGKPVAGELVTLFGSLGEVTPASAMSDANGRVIATYRAGQDAGVAMITALAGAASKSVTFQVGAPETPNQPSPRAFLPMIGR